MFNALFNDLIELLRTEPLDLPGFTKGIPLDLVTALRGIYSLGGDVDKYKRFIYNKDHDWIFIIYDGLIKDANHVVITDTIIVNGKFTHLLILDYDAMFAPYKVEGLTGYNVINLLYLSVSASILYLQTKNHALFFKKGNTPLRVVFDEAERILFIQLARTIYGDSDKKVREYIKQILAEKYTKSHNGDIFTDEVYDTYCSLADNNPISFLLDNSVIASIINPKTSKDSMDINTKVIEKRALPDDDKEESKDETIHENKE